MSPITSALNRQQWSSEAKAVGAFVWCLAAALLLQLAGGYLEGVAITLQGLLGTFLIVFVMAIGLYRWYFQPSGLGSAIERATG